MRKVFLLCLVFVFSNTFYAQDVESVAKKAKAKTEKTAKKVEEKTKSATKKAKEATEKTAKKVESKTKTTAKKVADKTESTVSKAASKTKKDGTPDKRFKEAVTTKKDGTPDKRYKENNASATGTAKSTAGKAKATANKAEAKVKKTAKEEAEDLKDSPVSRSAEKKVKDKVTGSYKGKKVFTGPRGGRYYINKNGNKTYISDDK